MLRTTFFAYSANAFASLRLLFQLFDRISSVLVFILAVCIHFSARSQVGEFSREINPFPVFDPSGSEYPLAFMGGLNRPTFQFVDIDADNDPDLFVRDKREFLKFFLNTGTASSARFEWVTDEYQTIEIDGWFRFVDADLDGDFDLFADNFPSIIRYYRNEGTPAAADFALLIDTLKDNTNAPVLVDIPTIPDWTDIDCDGDPDMFVGMLTGAISYFAHLGVGSGGDPVFELVTDSFQGLLIVTGSDNCRISALNGGPIQAHGASSMTFFDIDGDLDRDLFWGDFFAPSLLYLENSGTCQIPVIDLTEEQYPPVDPVCTGGFNVPAFVDLDDDGDSEMFIGVQGGAYSLTENLADNFYFYQNDGSSQQALFGLQTRRFLNGFDIGDKVAVGVVDIDADGDLELFAGNEAEPTNEASSRLHLLENQGTPDSALLNHTDQHYLGLEMGFNYAPRFVDIDADGDQDLILGEWDGNVNFFRNIGTPIIPSFVLETEDLGGTDIGNNSVPALVDIDSDGDLDLFIGEFLGTINLLRNNGTPQDFLFEFETSEFAGIDVGLYSAPSFTDIDHDGDYDLFVGSESEGVHFYRNTGTPLSPVFERDTVIFLPFHYRTVPVSGDMDGDGDEDLFLGGDAGGIVYYENLEIAVSVEPVVEDVPVPETLGLVRSFPNPFNPTTTIEFVLARPASVSILVYSVAGEEIAGVAAGHYEAGLQRVQWDAGRQSSGAYFAKIKAGEDVRVLKLLLTR